MNRLRFLSLGRRREPGRFARYFTAPMKFLLINDRRFADTTIAELCVCNYAHLPHAAGPLRGLRRVAKTTIRRRGPAVDSYHWVDTIGLETTLAARSDPGHALGNGT